MEFIREYWPLILGAAVICFGYVWLVLLPQLRENDVKNVYQHVAEPKIVMQVSEMETDFWARCEREKMRYLDSKNRWAIVQTPVIPFPINTAFEFEWFGEKHYRSTVGLSYAEYLVAGIQFYSEMRAIWDKKTTEHVGMQKMMELTRNQQPLTEDRLWQNIKKA